jgi:hypothetical protein
MKNTIKNTIKNNTNKYLSIIVLFVVFIIIIICGSFKPLNEGYEDYNFSWNNFYNSQNESTIALKKEKVEQVLGYTSLNDDVCEFPSCNQYATIQGSWVNKFNTNKKQDNKQDNKQNKPSTQSNDQRVLLNPKKFLDYNITAPECCKYNSSYSTGNGCLCITPEQSQFLSNRGGNR